jgi:threonine dehydrogenase-like Zn-dependent dehydrogenase
MKNPSIFFTAPERVEILDRPVPEPAVGEVLIRTRRSLISTGTELTLLSGRVREGSVWAGLSRYPQPVGYSNVGEVIAVAEGVDPAWVGRRVETHTCHALWVTCPVHELRAVPAGVTDEEATFCSLAEVAMNGLRRVGLTWGESVAVFGLGILGQLAVRLCALAGAAPIFGIEPSGFRRGLMPRGPVFHALDDWSGDLEDVVRRLNAERAVDIVIELTGKPEVIAREPLLLRDQGRLLLLSSPRDATLFDFHDLCNRRSLTIVGAHGSSHPPTESPSTPWTGRRHGELFLDRLSAGLSVRELVSHRFSYERAADAYCVLVEERDEAMGVVFEWT